MEMNFAFLEKKQEYELFSGACIDAERILESSPVMSAVASRKALELCVKWIYSIDSALEPIGNREGLQSLLHNNGFPSLMDITLWRRLQHIVRNGNESVHTSKRLTRDNAVLSLNILFDFVEWVDYCYGRDYVERVFDEKKIPDATTDECLEEIHKEEIIDHLAKLVVSDEKDEAAISFDVLMYGLMLSVMTGGKNLGRLKRYVVGNANILLKECATIPDIKVRISELKELVSDHYWDVQDVLKFEETRKSLREIMKYIPAKKEKLHYSNFKDIVVFREEGRLTSLSASDFEDYRAKVNEYVEAHKTTPAINKLLHNEPISVEDYNELERIFTVELGTAEDYEMNYQDTPFGLLIRKIAKMDRTAAYAAFSTFILEERPNTEQLHFIEQVVDYVVENGYINNVLDLMKTPFDRPYKFSLIFTYEEQVKFVKIINNIKNNALVT